LSNGLLWNWSERRWRGVTSIVSWKSLHAIPWNGVAGIQWKMFIHHLFEKLFRWKNFNNMERIPNREITGHMGGT